MADSNASFVGSRSQATNLLSTVSGRLQQRSTPELLISQAESSRALHSHNDGEQSMAATRDYKVPFSRSFTEKSAANNIPTGRKNSAIDTRHVQVYLRRQGSRASIHSTASAGLTSAVENAVTVPNAASPSSQSRPVSAEANPTNFVSHATKSNNAYPANTRIVAPNPTNNPAVARVFPPHVLNRSTSIPSLRRRSSYLDKLVCQVLDFLFMGGIEAAYNANLLCRLNIEYVIDISNVEPLKVPRNKRSDCPCLCSLETAHSRARMTIMIDEQSQLDLVPYFDDVNRFIDAARSCGKSVLVHSYNGKNRCAVLIVQYLMKTKKLPVERAEELLKGMCADVRVTENFRKSLRRWETIAQSKTYPNVNNNHTAGDYGQQQVGTSLNSIASTPFSSSLGPESFQAAAGPSSSKRSAWM